MCFQVDNSFSRDRRFIGMMDFDLFTSVVDQAAEHGCHSITLASRGEPTMHPRFGEMVGYLKEKGILDAKINTNATKLTERLAHQILEADIATVVFSVDAATKDTYERIRVRGKFDEVVENVARFNDIRAKHYPDSSITTRISGVAVEATQNPEEMNAFWSRYVDQVAIVSEVPRWDTYNNEVSTNERACPIFYERMYVWYDGVCNPCDFDYKSLLAVGDATKDSISSIWQGERMERYRALHNARGRPTLTPCDRCSI
jgi:hypothetical protein